MKGKSINPSNGSSHPSVPSRPSHPSNLPHPSNHPSRTPSVPSLPPPVPSDLPRLSLYKSILTTSPDWPRERRLSLRIKQSELARYLSISQPCLSFWESGETKPDDSRLLKWFDSLLSLDVPDKIKEIWGVLDNDNNPSPNTQNPATTHNPITIPSEQGDLF